MALATLLVGERRARRATDDPTNERRIDLKTPVPVYITYFTAQPTAGGLVIRPDVYGLDGRRIAAATPAPAPP